MIGLAVMVSNGWSPELLATAFMVADLKKMPMRYSLPGPRALS